MQEPVLHMVGFGVIVIDLALEQQSSIRPEQHRVGRHERSVGVGNRLGIVPKVWEGVPLLLRPRDHPVEAVVRVAPVVIRVDQDEPDALSTRIPSAARWSDPPRPGRTGSGCTRR